MGEEKFASLSSGLLARKGGAKPAMRRQNYINAQGDVSEDLGWNDMGDDEASVAEIAGGHDALNGHDAGQNGHDVNHVPEVHRQMDKLAGDLGAEPEKDHDPDAVIQARLPEKLPETVVEPEPAPAPEPVVEPKPIGGLTPVGADLDSAPKPAPAPNKAEKKVLARDKAAFTLRLDKDRHLKLRLVSAVSNRSAQQIVTEALDRFLETMPDIENYAGNAPGSEDS